MQVEIEGTITNVMEPREGTSSRSGNIWRRQDYVIQTPGQYPRKCLFTVADSNIDTFNLQQGQQVRVTLSIDAHEYNNRWFNDFRAIAVVPAGAPQTSTVPGMPPIGAPDPAAPQAPAGAQPLPWEQGGQA